MTSKEYTIFITCGAAKTYNILVYDSLFEAKRKLFDMVELERERHRPYYVFNDFYENEYPSSIHGKVFCLKERTVTEWEKCSAECITENTYNNVYKFPNIF